MINKKLPNFIILMILTLITLVFWISFSIYQVFATNPAEVVSNEIILELNAKLDTETINTIKNRI